MQQAASAELVQSGLDQQICVQIAGLLDSATEPLWGEIAALQQRVRDLERRLTAMQAAWIPLVPLLHATANFAPTFAANSASSCDTFLPRV